MENQEIKNKLENIEILLQTIIQTSNDPKVKSQEKQALTDAIISVNATKEEMKGLISEEKKLLNNFKPTVEVKQMTVDVDLTQPWYWVSAAILLLAISIGLNFHFYNKKEFYRIENAKKMPNYMKYKYIKYYIDEGFIEKLDKDFKANFKEMNDKILQREEELFNAANAEAEAEQKAAEAERLRHVADSLNSIKRY